MTKKYDEDLEDIEDLEDEEADELEEESEEEEQKGKKTKKEKAPVKQSQCTDVFTKAIENYVNEFAEHDTHFKECLQNPKKSIVECCAYIVGQVMKLGKTALDDSEVFQMARHYYLEDIKPADLQTVYKPDLVKTTASVEFTEEELKEIKQRAIDNYQLPNEEVAKLKKQLLEEKKKEILAEKESKKKEKEKEVEKQNVYDGGLFDFI